MPSDISDKAADDDSEVDVEARCGTWLQAGACTACGCRASNEDQHLMICDWCPAEGEQAGLFAVLDGHGGPATAILISRLLPRKLRAVLGEGTAGALAWHSPQGRRAAVERAFLELDSHLSGKEAAQHCGSTCVVGIVRRSSSTEDPTSRDCEVLLANLGDSRGIVVRGNTAIEDSSDLIIGETVDHKPENPLEAQRIMEAGGRVVRPNFGGPCRVDGDLALSRAFGDFHLKDNGELPPEKQKVSALPDVTEFSCRLGDILVLACDGVYDVLTSARVAELAQSVLSPHRENAMDLGKDPSHAASTTQQAAEMVVRTSLLRGTTDNVTCVVVRLGALTEASGDGG